MNKYVLLMIFALTAAFCIAADQPAQTETKAVKVSEGDFWSEDWGPDNFPKITEDRINQVLVQIRKENPARADELEKLRKEDIEKFRAQIRTEVTKLLRLQPPHEGGPGGPQGPGQPGPGGPGPGPNGAMSPGDRPGGQQGQRGEPGSPERWRSRMERMHDDFITWMEKNYPEQAAVLKQVREKEPDKYMEKVMDKMRVYDPIRQTERSNPKLAQVMKDDLVLQEQRDAILRQLRKASDKDKEKLIAELKDNVSHRFDIIMDRKKLQYEELKKQLEDVQKQVCSQEKELEKLKNNKDKTVEEHVKELADKAANKAVKMNWD